MSFPDMSGVLGKYNGTLNWVIIVWGKGNWIRGVLGFISSGLFLGKSYCLEGG